jgi:hypothetical protein
LSISYSYICFIKYVLNDLIKNDYHLRKKKSSFCNVVESIHYTDFCRNRWIERFHARNIGARLPYIILLYPCCIILLSFGSRRECGIHYTLYTVVSSSVNTLLLLLPPTVYITMLTSCYFCTSFDSVILIPLNTIYNIVILYRYSVPNYHFLFSQ